MYIRRQSVADLIRQPFYRLPIIIDQQRLIKEVTRLDDSWWLADRFAEIGKAVQLISFEGNLGEKGWYRCTPMKETKNLKSFPYIKQILSFLGGVYSEVCLRKIPPFSEIPPHYDNHYFRHERVRIHIPIISSSETYFRCGSDIVNMKQGECWTFNRLNIHSVKNAGNTSRVHLVIDSLLTSSLRSILFCKTRVNPAFVEYKEDFEPKLFTDKSKVYYVLTPVKVYAYILFLINIISNCKIRYVAREQIKKLLLAFYKTWVHLYMGAHTCGDVFKDLSNNTEYELAMLEKKYSLTIFPKISDRLRLFLRTGAIRNDLK